MVTNSILADIGTEITLLSRIAYGNSVAAGWYTDLETGQPKELHTGEEIALIHSEISEALSAHRSDEMDTHLPNRKAFEVELADAVLRIMNLAGYHGMDIGRAIVEKMEYNRHREDHKIENRMKANGKKY